MKKTNDINVRNILENNDLEDKSGNTSLLILAYEVKMSEILKKEYLKEWILFIKEIPFLNHYQYCDYLNFVKYADLDTKEFYVGVSKFIKNEWNEIKYPNPESICRRGSLIRDIVFFDNTLFTSFDWIKENSPIVGQIYYKIMKEIHDISSLKSLVLR